MTQRNTHDTLAWYNTNKDSPPFNPRGMCLKICRTARNIPSRFPSALAAQEATPMADRVHKVSDIYAGMVAFFDDPNDSNPFGHIVTIHGRVKGADPNSLHDLLAWTNDVQTGKYTLVRADYFVTHNWGDFQFAATSLNGVALDLPDRKKPAPPLEKLGKAGNLHAAIADLQRAVEWHQAHNHPRIVAALQRDIIQINKTIERFSK